MAQAKKKYMRRKAAQAVKHQMNCIACLIELKELFVEFHPEWDELFIAICNNCSISIAMIKTLCVRAWGVFPDKLDTWLK